ncbi:MAG: right-handed parallel beta-helix repeat-containing protein, partial [Bacteroidota bacterium]
MIISSFRVRLGLILFFTLSSLSATFGFQTFTDYVITTDSIAGPGSLHDALVAIDGQTGSFRITFDSTLKGARIPYGYVIEVLAGDLIMDGDVDGDDVADVILDGQLNATGINSATTATKFELHNIEFENISYRNFYREIFRLNSQVIQVQNCSFSNFRGYLFYSSGNVTVNNTTFTASRNVYGLFVLNGGYGTITNCVFNDIKSIPGWTIFFQLRGGALTLQNTLIHDNEITIPFRSIGGQVTLSHVTMADNTIFTRNTSYDAHTFYGENGAQFTLENSLLVSNLAPNGSNPGSSIDPESDFQSTGTLFDDDLTGYFNNLSGGDFTPAKGSPAFDAGEFGLVGDLTTDLAGNPRPSYGFGTDAGAFERQFLPTTTTFYYTVTNTQSSGPGSLNAILDSVNLTAGNHFISFADTVAGQTIPFERKIDLAGSLTILGDIDGDQRSDVTLSSNGHEAGITSTTRDVVLTLDGERTSQVYLPLKRYGLPCHR